MHNSSTDLDELSPGCSLCAQVVEAAAHQVDSDWKKDAHIGLRVGGRRYPVRCDHSPQAPAISVVNIAACLDSCSCLFFPPPAAVHYMDHMTVDAGHCIPDVRADRGS